MARNIIDPDLMSTGSNEPLQALVGRVARSVRWHESVNDIHAGLLSMATETLLPALGDLALRLRGTGAIELSDGTRLVADHASPRHRTDLLVIRKDQGRAHYVFVCHQKRMSDRGKAADAQLRNYLPEDLLQEILKPSQERRDFDANPDHWCDPEPGDRVERVGATHLRLAPAEGFQSFQPATITPSIWWPEMSLNLEPSIALHPDKIGEATHALRFNRTASDPYEELRLLRDLSSAVQEAGLGNRVEERMAKVDAARWLTCGDENREARLGLGMRLVRETGGYVDDGLIVLMSRVERQIFAALVEKDVETLRRLGQDLLSAGITRVDDAFECNDGRDSAWAESAGDKTILHLRNQSGAFAMEFSEDQSIRISKGALSPKVIETLVWRPSGYISLGPSNADSASIELVRDRNAVLLSLTSIACQMPSPQDGPSP